MISKVLLLIGPTAVGKSSIALDVANVLDAVIINADAIQVYQENPILSAQPSKSSAIDHRLYGYIKGETRYSVGHFLQDIRNAIDYTLDCNKLPIVVGGTMMYVNCILNGLSSMPQIPDTVANYGMDTSVDILYKQLQEIDHEYSKIVNPRDKQRILRAIHIKTYTNSSIIDFWNKKDTLFDDIDFIKVVINKDKELIHGNCSNRLHQMLEAGLLNEVTNMINLKYNQNSMIYKTIGFREFADYLSQRISLNEAIDKTLTATKQYVKRQLTWIRNENFKSFQTCSKFEDVLNIMRST